MIKKFSLIIITIFLGAFGASAEQVVLKYHSFLPMPHSANSKFVKPWAERLASQSGGKLKVEIYPSMQLGGKPPPIGGPSARGRCGSHLDRSRVHTW